MSRCGDHPPIQFCACEKRGTQRFPDRLTLTFRRPPRGGAGHPPLFGYACPDFSGSIYLSDAASANVCLGWKADCLLLAARQPSGHERPRTRLSRLSCRADKTTLKTLLEMGRSVAAMFGVCSTVRCALTLASLNTLPAAMHSLGLWTACCAS